MAMLVNCLVPKSHGVSYDIITPTVWNLGNGSNSYPAVAQKAIVELSSVSEADLVFKAFDVCAVCTTQ